MKLVRLTMLISACALIGCTNNAAPVIRLPTSGEVAAFAKNARLTVPAAAHAVAYCEEHGIDDALWLQLKMPTNELQPFLDGSPFAETVMRVNEPFCLSHFDRFISTTPAKYRGDQRQLPNASVLNIAIDESENESVVVYLMWHEI